MSEKTNPENNQSSEKAEASPDDAVEIEILPTEPEANQAIKEDPPTEDAPAAAKNENVENLEAALAKAKSDYLYLMADFENFKKNSLKERSDYLKYGSERLIVELLEVVDNFHRALEIEINSENPETIESYKKGVEMTAQELSGVLARFGVNEVQCKGQAFDPNLHEALGSEETDQLDAGHITNVFKSPYKLHDKLIRPGQVIVAKEKSSN